MKDKFTKGVSNIWDGLLSSFSVISEWLAWVSRNDKSILVGEDPIIGGLFEYLLSHELILSMRIKGYYTLNHVSAVN